MHKYLVGLVLGLFLLVPGRASAATQPAAQKGISISPVIQSLSTAGFEPIKSFKVTVQNQTDTTRKFSVDIADFEAQGERGGIAILPVKANSFSERGLRAWMNVDQDKFTLKAGKKKVLNVSIDNNANLLPGGHYGAILVTQETGNKRSAKNTVAANPTVSSLVFLTKIGGEKYDLTLKSMEVSSSIWHYPKQAELRFYNPGNTPVVPRGTVSLQNGRQQEFARGVINPDSAMVLPGSYRRLDVAIQDTGSAGRGPRAYTAVAQYRYDGIAEFATLSRKHFFVDAPFILLLTAVIGGVVYAVRGGHVQRLWKSLRKQ